MTSENYLSKKNAFSKNNFIYFSDIKTDLSIKIYDWIDYLCDFENCRKLKTLFKNEFVKLEADSRKKFEENLIEQEKYQTKDSPKLNRNYPWLQNYEIKSLFE